MKHTYIARAQCGCVKLIMSLIAGLEPHPKFVQDLAWAMQQGYDFEHVATKDVQGFEPGSCDACRYLVGEQQSFIEVTP